MKRDLRKRASVQRDEPGVDSSGDLILAAEFTEAGLSCGPLDEQRTANARNPLRPGWARAKHAIERVCSAAFKCTVDVDFVKRRGSGLSRDAFGAFISAGPQELDVYALVPNEFAAPDYDRRAVFELRLLSALSQRKLKIRVPKVFGALRDQGGVILVEQLLEGVTLDLRAGRQGRVEPWVVIAEIAAEVHALEVDGLPEELPKSPDCRAYGETLVASIRREHPLLSTATRWMAEHLPPRDPCVLLHGDLLGQNVHLGFDEPPGVLDWEKAELGDPAYELAVVTRGVRQPFQTVDGLAKLLNAYSVAGGRALPPARVGFYELGILATQFQEVLQNGGDVQGAESRLSAVLKRLSSR